MSMMKRSTPRSFTEFRWVWKVMTVLASIDPFRITRAVPGRPFTSWTWMVRSGTAISKKMGDASERYDTPAPRGSQGMPRTAPPRASEGPLIFIVRSAVGARRKMRGGENETAPRGRGAVSVADRWNRELDVRRLDGLALV